MKKKRDKKLEDVKMAYNAKSTRELKFKPDLSKSEKS